MKISDISEKYEYNTDRIVRHMIQDNTLVNNTKSDLKVPESFRRCPAGSLPFRLSGHCPDFFSAGAGRNVSRK